MECHLMGTTRCCLHNRIQWFPWQLRTLNLEKVNRFHYDVAECRSRTRTQRFIYPNLASTGKNYMHHISWRTISMPVSLDQESSSPQLEDYSSDDEDAPKTSPLEKPLSSDELKALIADSEREKLIKKLSEANQQNRFLKRQLHEKEGALVNFKSELAVMEQEIQALVAMADEIAKYGIPERSRKINGKYIQSHLLSRLEAVHEKVKEQIKDVDAAESKEVSLFWCGMAEGASPRACQSPVS
ncbi:protein PTST, chloroplastic isoform X2 [Camellia sinensis]|uniref:protein PTST, chloroplastic isoform X2 n=1 Tax=Camellia sinensis TaxID=4442 RepID=UPI001036403F|nr:protein PTST, chloroplastic isoform X2 [Camellia sinensis]